MALRESETERRLGSGKWETRRLGIRIYIFFCKQGIII
jgi:hypothetical protein